MFRSSNFIVIAGLIAFLAWSGKSTKDHTAAVRASVVGTYKLSEQQAKVYDTCVDALTHKRLKSGGSTESFCGCFAGAAASDDSGAKYSVGILQQLEGDVALDDRAARMRLIAQDSTYASTFIRTAKVSHQCADDQRHTFASEAAHQTLCAAKPERATDDRCRPRPL